MSRFTLPKPSPRTIAAFLILCVLIAAFIIHQLLLPAAYGAELGERSMQLGDSKMSATTDYQLTFNLATAGTLGSIAIEFCSNSALPDDSCTPPNGFSANQAVLAEQAGPTGFTISNASTANKIILSRTPSFAAIQQARYHFTGVTNPSDEGSYFVRVTTYASSNASGTSSDYDGIAFAILGQVTISAEVPPYLTFCTAVTINGLNCANTDGDYVDFGELSSNTTRSGTSQLLVATNAAEGYNVSANGTTLTSGNNVITAMSPTDVSRPGVAQFGFNLRANQTPGKGSDPTGPGTAMPTSIYNQPNFYRFVSGDTILDNPQPDDVRKFTATYLANVPTIQAPGIYVSTITYVCLANF